MSAVHEHEPTVETAICPVCGQETAVERYGIRQLALAHHSRTVSGVGWDLHSKRVRLRFTVSCTSADVLEVDRL